MAKKVRYNGGKESLYKCSAPSKLVVGREYEVVLSRNRRYYTNYTLKGVSGEFNSDWFDDISPDDKVYMAYAHTIPVTGKTYFCYKVTMVNCHPTTTSHLTSIVKETYYMGNNIYRVTTFNSTYIVYVG